MTEQQLHVTFLGTGTSMGVPVIGCDCPVCLSDDPHNARLRTSALLSCGSSNILIDAGPDFRSQALRHRIGSLDAVCLTHAHYDHVAGLDDLRPLTMRSGSSMPIYGHPDTLASVRERFEYAFRPPTDGSTRPDMQLLPIEHYTTFAVPFNGSTLPLLPFDVWHGSGLVTGYRVGKLGYITDASYLPDATLALLHGLDVLVINALRYRPHPTHFSLEQALAVIEQLQPARAYLVHLTHAFEHAAVNRELPAGVALAHDGLTVTVGG